MGPGTQSVLVHDANDIIIYVPDIKHTLVHSHWVYFADARQVSQRGSGSVLLKDVGCAYLGLELASPRWTGGLLGGEGSLCPGGLCHAHALFCFSGEP